ncbi:hypothetical protein JCM6882_006538 [Rhodosporidiobolus microsporus]
MSPVAIHEPAAPVEQQHPLKAAANSAPPPPGDFKQSLEGLSSNPIDRIWRGNKEGSIKLQTIPDFGEDLLAKRQWVKEHLASAFQYWGKQGYGEGVAGHITVRDPIKPDHYWMNPFAVHFSSITVSSLCLVTPDGFVAPEGAQLPINTAGFHIHSAIHKERPEVNAIAHCHSPNGKAWSVFGRPIDMLVQDSCFFYDNLAVYKSFGGIVLAQEEGTNIAKALGPKNMTAILQNHGLLTLGDTVDGATYYFQLLERLCKLQLQVEAAAANGIPKNYIDPEDAAFTASTLQSKESLYLSFQVERNLLVEERGEKFLK